MEKKIIYVDASSLKSDSLCDRRYLLHIIRGWTKGARAANYKAGYGTAFHAFLENYYAIPAQKRSGELVRLIDIALAVYAKYTPYITDPTEYRTADHLEKSIRAYHERYQRGDSLVPLTYDIPGGAKSLLETKFCIPWFEDDELIIYLTGTIDTVTDYFGRPIILDHKSSGCPPHKIESFFREFEMNIQTQFYVWIFKRLTGMDKYLPIMINGIFIKRCTKKAEESGKFDGVTFQRSQLIEYTDAQMEQFEDWLTERLNHIKSLAKRYASPELLGPVNPAACHGRFSTCPFYEVCAAPPGVQDKLLRSQYSIDPYNPLKFND